MPQICVLGRLLLIMEQPITISFSDLISQVFNYTVKHVFGLKDYEFRIINRRSEKQRILGYINFRKKIIALDIYTAKKRVPKKISSLLRTIAHEIAHIQKPPYRSLYKGHFIARQHYPAFYRQVKKNIKTIQKNEVLSKFF